MGHYLYFFGSVQNIVKRKTYRQPILTLTISACLLLIGEIYS